MNQALIISCEATRQRALEHIAGLSPDKVWEVTVARQVKHRTLKQLALMWVWVDTVAKIVGEETGHDKEELHEIFKHNFLPAKILQVEGLEPTERRTTKGLNTIEMGLYMDKIFRWATQDMGFVLPLPPVQTEER